MLVATFYRYQPAVGAQVLSYLRNSEVLIIRNILPDYRAFRPTGVLTGVRVMHAGIRYRQHLSENYTMFFNYQQFLQIYRVKPPSAYGRQNNMQPNTPYEKIR